MRPLVAGGDPAHGIAQLDPNLREGWFNFKTLWFSEPSYQGPWRIRGARIDAPGPMAFGEGPQGSELLVPPFQTVNGTGGYREAPGGTYVKGPGCYAWQVDALGFTTVLVVQVMAAA